MDKKRKVQIKEDGNRISFKLNDPANEQQAAVLEDSEEDPAEPLTMVTDHQKKKKQTGRGRFSRFHLWRPVLLAGISAIGIGSVLGFVMLRMIAGIDAGVPQNGSLPAGTVDTEEQEAQSKEGSRTPEGLEAFVVQGGVFGNRENAEEWAGKFSTAGVPQVIWLRDGQYFLFVGAAETEDAATRLSEKMESQQLETFVKEWETGQAEVELTDTESEWLLSFEEVWQSNLARLPDAVSVDIDSWEKLLETFPDESEKLSSLRDEISSQKDRFKQQDVEGAQQALLNLWYQYEQALRE
ncbi:SPOR domain-containing protein [Virgibacillus sediminis]|uniref:SPOR domain-containing protein n=1 Tax=Virgibacillus sediminis TaxID=202260 RepID=A0ABV7A5Y1_9BACI